MQPPGDPGARLPLSLRPPSPRSRAPGLSQTLPTSCAWQLMLFFASLDRCVPQIISVFSVSMGQRVNSRFADHLDLRSRRDWEDFCARRTTRPQCVLYLAVTARPTASHRPDDDQSSDAGSTHGMGSSGSSDDDAGPSSDSTVDANRQKKRQPARARVPSANSDDSDGSSSDDSPSVKVDKKPARKRRRAHIEQAEEEDIEVCVKACFVQPRLLSTTPTFSVVGHCKQAFVEHNTNLLCRRTLQAGKWGYSGYRLLRVFSPIFP